jgi:hypothetical protein
MQGSLWSGSDREYDRFVAHLKAMAPPEDLRRLTTPVRRAAFVRPSEVHHANRQ